MKPRDRWLAKIVEFEEPNSEGRRQQTRTKECMDVGGYNNTITAKSLTGSWCRETGLFVKTMVFK